MEKRRNGGFRLWPEVKVPPLTDSPITCNNQPGPLSRDRLLYIMLAFV